MMLGLMCLLAVVLVVVVVVAVIVTVIVVVAVDNNAVIVAAAAVVVDDVVADSFVVVVVVANTGTRTALQGSILRAQCARTTAFGGRARDMHIPEPGQHDIIPSDAKTSLCLLILALMSWR